MSRLGRQLPLMHHAAKMPAHLIRPGTGCRHTPHALQSGAAPHLLNKLGEFIPRKAYGHVCDPHEVPPQLSHKGSSTRSCSRPQCASSHATAESPVASGMSPKLGRQLHYSPDKTSDGPKPHALPEMPLHLPEAPAAGFHAQTIIPICSSEAWLPASPALVPHLASSLPPGATLAPHKPLSLSTSASRQPPPGC